MTIETTYSQAREQLKSLMETAHLLHSPKNAQRLLNALARARTETLEPMTMKDLQQMVGFGA